MNQNFGVIVLAAGASADRQRPKQLLPYLGKTLIEHAAVTALASGAREVIVVVGSDAPALREKLKNLPVRVVFNRDWDEGMSSSIRCGIAALSPEIGCAVIALCDQPRMTPGLLRDLAQRQFESGAAIVASSYDGVVGAPSAFGIEAFPELMALQGVSGARDVIRRSPVPIETIEFSGGNIDIEAPELFKWFLFPQTVEPLLDMQLSPWVARGPPQLMRRLSSTA